MRYKFNEIAINSVEKRIPTEDDKANYIGLEHLESGSLSVSTWGSAVSLKGEKLVMRKGDVLFGKRNTYLRRASIAPHDGLFSAHGMVLRPKPEVIDPSFFPFFVNSDGFFNSTIRISVGSLSPTVNWKDMKELEFDLPPIEKQRELAELLWAANDLKESYKKLIAATDEMLKAKFREMFGGDSASRNKWEKKTFDQLCDVITDGEHITPRRVDKGILLLSCRNVTNEGLDFSQVDYIDDAEYQRIARRIIPQADDILISCSGTVGRCCRVPHNLTFQMVRSVALLRFKSCMTPAFAECMIKSEDLQRQISNSAVKTSQANLFQGRIKQLTATLPPLALQQEFVEIARKADETKAALKKSIADVESVIKGLING